MSVHIEKLHKILEYAVKAEASDIHLLAKMPPHFRINGILTRGEFEMLDQTEIREMILSILPQGRFQEFEAQKELDFSYWVENLNRFRINLHYQRGSIGVAIRPIKNKIPTFEELGLNPETMRKLLDQPFGLILVCGPTGSGKSTTLAAMVEYINNTKDYHIITVEDPIEYLFKHKRSLVEQRELGDDTHTFVEALKRVLRQDPDMVLIGEMRDLETIQVALRIAETGHLVLATLHTGEVVQATGRMVNVFPPEQQPSVQTELSLVLQGTIVQQLLPGKKGNGRVLATEIMISTFAIRNLIKDTQFAQIYSHIQLGGNLGMHTMNSSLVDLVRKDRISVEAAIAGSSRPKELESLLRK